MPTQTMYQATLDNLNAEYNRLLDNRNFCPGQSAATRIAEAVFGAAEMHGFREVRGGDSGTIIYAHGDMEVCGWYDTNNREDGGFDDQVWDDDDAA